MTPRAGAGDAMQPGELHVVHTRAAGLDVHKMQITASVRICEPGGGVQCTTRQCSALPEGLRALTQWLAEHRVTAAAMDRTGIFWKAPWEAMEAADIEPQLLHAQFVKQLQGRKSDVADSVWLARICQFGMCRPRGERAGALGDRESDIFALFKRQAGRPEQAGLLVRVYLGHQRKVQVWDAGFRAEMIRPIAAQPDFEPAQVWVGRWRPTRKGASGRGPRGRR